MGQCSSCPEDPCKDKLPGHQLEVLCNATGFPPQLSPPADVKAAASCVSFSELKAACNARCQGPQSVKPVDLGRAAPFSLRSPQSLSKDSWDKGFMQNSGGRGPNDWEEEVVAPETAWKAARHADATYSPRWNWTRRYMEYSSPCQVKSTLNALADATWVLSSSPATPHIGTIITDWSRSMSQSPSKLSECSPQFGTRRPIPAWTGGKENSLSSEWQSAALSSCGKENIVPDLGFFQDPAVNTVSSICSRTSICPLRHKPQAMMTNDMSCKRASIRNAHIGRGL